MPEAIDPLLDLAADDPEQNLPYWAELWPSGIALADLIERIPQIVRGQRTFELGCGLGVTAIAALRAGAVLTVGDYSEEALELCRLNCDSNADAVPVAVTINWRCSAKAQVPALVGRFPVVLAADVLYERRDIEPMVSAISELLEPGGVIWLAEPGRPVAAEFLARLETLGWRRRSRRHVGPWPDPSDAGVVVALHELRPPG
jgi:predicted nicotinamide N-methyase